MNLALEVAPPSSAQLRMEWTAQAERVSAASGAVKDARARLDDELARLDAITEAFRQAAARERAKRAA